MTELCNLDFRYLIFFVIWILSFVISFAKQKHGDVAQLGERLLCKQRVRGSSPLISTINHSLCTTRVARVQNSGLRHGHKKGIKMENGLCPKPERREWFGAIIWHKDFIDKFFDDWYSEKKQNHRLHINFFLYRESERRYFVLWHVVIMVSNIEKQCLYS